MRGLGKFTNSIFQTLYLFHFRLEVPFNAQTHNKVKTKQKE